MIERTITASSNPGDTVWEPFGGLCSAAVVSLKTGRCCISAEINPDYYRLAQARILRSVLETDLWDTVPTENLAE